MKNILTEALVNLATNASFIFQLYKFCKVKDAYFVDFFNAYFFDGEKILKPENCEELDSEMNDAHMDLEKHVDVIRKYNDGSLYSAFIIENQSRVDASMVVRAATYEYVAYERMLKKL